MLPRSYILHDFWFDLTLAQIQGKHGLLPGQQQTVHVKLRQMKKFAFRGVSPTGHEKMDIMDIMDMRIPMEQLPKRLDGRNQAGHDIRQVQHAPDFGLEQLRNDF